MNGFMQIPSEAPRPHRAEPRLSVAVLSVCLFDDPADLLPYTAAWEKLAAQALEPNVFYEPWMLLPALEAYGAGEELLFALVFEGEPQSRLVGFFPLQRRRLHRRLPVSILGLWRHIHCYLCTPLVRPDCASAVLAALLDTLNTDPRGASVVEFNHVLGSGPFSALLQASFQTRENPTIVLGSHERALFRPRGDGEHICDPPCLESDVGHCNAGSVVWPSGAPSTTRRWSAATTSKPGRRGSCVWRRPAGRASPAPPCLATQSTAAISAPLLTPPSRDRLFLCSMCHAGAPIAFRCSFLAGDGAFAFKMTYDERYRKYSPGVLLEMEYIRRLHVLPGLRWMDSCTAADNGMMNQLWPCRRTIQTLLVATGQCLGRCLAGLGTWLRALKRRLSRPPHLLTSPSISEEEAPA